MFTKILIANRGEIACRIMRTAQRLGITCVAIFSEADAHALHVKLADEAYCVGPASTRESYLRGDVIIATALKCGAQAIHPGYGFLSENADFAEACQRAGLCFIGPPVKAIRLMGSKSKAKEIMEKAGVPLIAGYHGADQKLDTLRQAAEKIGYPVLLKAAAGGGGKGMRVINNSTEFKEGLESAKREALASFGNDEILIEKYLTQPRHIESQIFADELGNVVHLFERDCSIQRRHQKIIEEAPAPNLSAALREKISQAAIAAAKAIGYTNAGTIEFLLDSDGSFYFMEMNTRLQVEHPVTEMITQQDLVEWQLRVANGEPLPCKQADLKIHGHAIEARIYAEDPNNDFLPSIGHLQFVKTPAESASVRLDTGVTQGDNITSFYDPMIAKLIAWGKDRETALVNLSRALSEYQVVGVTTNLNLLTEVCRHPEFIKANLSTHFIPTHFSELITTPSINKKVVALAACYVAKTQQKAEDQHSELLSPWKTFNGWRLNLPAEQTFRFNLEGDIKVTLEHLSENNYLFKSQTDLMPLSIIELQNNNLILDFENQEIKASVFIHADKIFILFNGLRYQLELVTNKSSEQDQEQTKSHLISPLPGKIVALLVKENSNVEAGASLAVIEAMKMEHTIHAPSKGLIKEWYFKVGDLVEEGVELLNFEAS